jgi:very-short-patch-repair endonuclease
MTITASKPEQLVYAALVKLIGEDNFSFQSSFFGGRDVKGGIVADFYIPMLNLILAVQGEYWHYEKVERKAVDEIQRLALESQGIQVIMLDEEDVLENAEYYVKEALNGIDHSKGGK